jgi:hypothetical protein
MQPRASEFVMPGACPGHDEEVDPNPIQSNRIMIRRTVAGASSGTYAGMIFQRPGAM